MKGPSSNSKQYSVSHKFMKNINIDLAIKKFLYLTKSTRTIACKYSQGKLWQKNKFQWTVPTNKTCAQERIRSDQQGLPSCRFTYCRCWIVLMHVLICLQTLQPQAHSMTIDCFQSRPFEMSTIFLVFMTTMSRFYQEVPLKRRFHSMMCGQIYVTIDDHDFDNLTSSAQSVPSLHSLTCLLLLLETAGPAFDHHSKTLLICQFWAAHHCCQTMTY